MFGVKVTSCNTHCPHFLKHVSHYDLPNVDSDSTHLFFFSHCWPYCMLQIRKFCFKHWQCAKKVVSDSLELVDFAIGLVNSVFNLPDGQVKFFEEFE